MRLPDLPKEIAQCRRHGQNHDDCMVRYVDLMPSNLQKRTVDGMEPAVR